MNSEKLPNYLRMHRKRVGLTQDEVAYLLGCRFGTKVSRYERFGRKPNLETAFAYEVIFHAPAREIFAGLYEGAEREVSKRARGLARRLLARTTGPTASRKHASLSAIAEPLSEEPRYEPLP